jgi:hypothetical protein
MPRALTTPRTANSYASVGARCLKRGLHEKKLKPLGWDGTFERNSRALDIIKKDCLTR